MIISDELKDDYLLQYEKHLTKKRLHLKTEDNFIYIVMWMTFNFCKYICLSF